MSLWIISWKRPLAADDWIRQTYLYERKENLPESWQSISRIAYVHCIRLTKTGGHTSDSFYVSDLETDDDAKYMAAGIRSHWGIKNKLHYTKDVHMREDRQSTANYNVMDIYSIPIRA